MGKDSWPMYRFGNHQLADECLEAQGLPQDFASKRHGSNKSYWTFPRLTSENRLVVVRESDLGDYLFTNGTRHKQFPDPMKIECA